MKKSLKSFFLLFTVLIGLNACQTDLNYEPSLAELLTSHKWQMISESSMNLKSELLTDNIIELKSNGVLVYYDDLEGKKVFTQNRWQLSKDQKKLIEILTNNIRIEREIVEISSNHLKIRHLEPNGMGGKVSVTETYERLKY